LAGGREIIKISLEEWERLRESLRLDDLVDYERGETPMTGYQFLAYLEMYHEVKQLEAEKETLKTVLKAKSCD